MDWKPDRRPRGGPDKRNAIRYEGRSKAKRVRPAIHRKSTRRSKQATVLALLNLPSGATSGSAGRRSRQSAWWRAGCRRGNRAARASPPPSRGQALAAARQSIRRTSSSRKIRVPTHDRSRTRRAMRSYQPIWTSLQQPPAVFLSAECCAVRGCFQCLDLAVSSTVSTHRFDWTAWLTTQHYRTRLRPKFPASREFSREFCENSATGRDFCRKNI